ncbi:zinc metalloprotease [Ureibacillus massiliensis 4400831 = CIP 108448 = CCUG 49529]|uniref:Zinc metalloprotease n=1 Tax=Ureibacillus massiliensis 4400831 = CIP 108448 = CCUG 49529 TaxID=1211035 RepID=A0A0A3JYG1_9BACL|nr:RIP metalloprotease RseP [Ureibacillus massiliensis]KGR92042.1 zinc metalloprotease [Ureibacillus massiliensis 4400831 = CIP 108448 = CCUG 49529]
MQTVIAFIIIFGSLVFFHELGHFIFAKRAGIMVREFAIGMGPKIFGMMKGETLYTIRLLPLGGYVRMAGEDVDQIELQPGYRVGIILNNDDIAEKIYLNQNVQHPNVVFLEVERADLEKDLFIEGYDEDEHMVRYSVSRNATIVENGTELMIAPVDRQFNSKTVGQRAMAIFAGPLFNFILAFFILMALGFLSGVPSNEPIISSVQDNSAAQVAGMESGDYVKAINGQEIDNWTELSGTVQENPGKPLNFIVERDGQELELVITPSTLEENGTEFGQIGVLRPIEKDPIKAVVFGATQTWDYTILIGELLGKLVTGQFSIDALSGPVGIYKATETVAQYGIFNLMNWAALLSINLGIMNLLPLPALDGGRLLFFGIEAVRGKPIDRQKEGMVHFVGIVLLMLLMVVVTWNDIQRFFF